MLIIFSSQATAQVMMLDDLATRLLAILGRQLETRGIITVEQLPAAIKALENAIAQDDQPSAEKNNAEPEETSSNEHLRLAQRAFPLLNMLRRAEEKNKPVVWGI